jgi:hypothetical protein
VGGQLSLWLGATWWASLSLLGFVVVPLLFMHLPTPAMAGAMAAHLFSAQTWVSCACAGALLVLNLLKHDDLVFGMERKRIAWFPVLAGLGLLCAVLVEWVVAPRIVAREDLQLWHRLGSAMYLLQWLCAIAVFQLLLRRQAVARARWHA